MRSNLSLIIHSKSGFRFIILVCFGFVSCAPAAPDTPSSTKKSKDEESQLNCNAQNNQQQTNQQPAVDQTPQANGDGGEAVPATETALLLQDATDQQTTNQQQPSPGIQTQNNPGTYTKPGCPGWQQEPQNKYTEDDAVDNGEEKPINDIKRGAAVGKSSERIAADKCIRELGYYDRKLEPDPECTKSIKAFDFSEIENDPKFTTNKPSCTEEGLTTYYSAGGLEGSFISTFEPLKKEDYLIDQCIDCLKGSEEPVCGIFNVGSQSFEPPTTPKMMVTYAREKDGVIEVQSTAMPRLVFPPQG